MERMWLLIALVGWGGCADVVERPSHRDGAPWQIEPVEEEEEVEVIERVEFVIDVTLPEPGECEETSRIGAPNLENTVIAPPAITERIGADGCVDERWVQKWDGERIVHQVYQVWDVDFMYYAYVMPYSHTHVWTYDAEGQLVEQSRTPLDETIPRFAEQTTYDHRGRMIRQVRRNDPFSTIPDDYVVTQTWTFSPLNETEFERRTLEEGAYFTGERRVFGQGGRIVEEYYSPDAQTEHLVRRTTFDDRGHSTRIETWDRHTGVAQTSMTIARRADGTIQKRTEKHLAFGWLSEWTHDGAERVTRFTQDEDDDGRLEYEQVFRFDDRGNLVFESTEYGFNQPRTQYSEVRWTFDEENRVVEQFATPTWRDGDSYRQRTTYDADGPGYELIGEILDEAGRVVRVQQVERWYDSERFERREFYYDDNSSMVETHTWAGARPVERLADYDGDGGFDIVEQWLYDAAGQLAAHQVDHDGDGVVDRQTLYAR